MHNYKKLFERPLPSSRSGAFYNTFPYPTRRKLQTEMNGLSEYKEYSQACADVLGISAVI